MELIIKIKSEEQIPDPQLFQNTIEKKINEIIEDMIWIEDDFEGNCEINTEVIK
jgi:hypothetical protein